MINDQYVINDYYLLAFYTNFFSLLYTGCFILIAPGKYLEKYGNYEKMFRTKVV